jgi:hypothetical protein
MAQRSRKNLNSKPKKVPNRKNTLKGRTTKRRTKGIGGY